MFSFYVLMVEIKALIAMCLALGTLFDGKMDLRKGMKAFETMVFIVIKVLAIGIILLGMVFIVVMRAIWKFK